VRSITTKRLVISACAGLAATMATVAPVAAFVGNVPPAPGIAGGSTVTSLTPALGSWGYSLVMSNGTLYFTTTESSSHTCNLWRSNSAGQNRSVVTSLSNCYLMGVAVGPDGRLWFGTDKTSTPIYSIKIDGSDRRQMAIAPHGASRLAFDGLGHLYVESESNKTVDEMNLDGTGVHNVASALSSYGFAIDHSGHFFVDLQSTLDRFNVDGSADGAFDLGSNIESVLPLADGNLLWSDYGAGTTYLTDATGSVRFTVSSNTPSIEQIAASSTTT
jgi:sugar lactone lactonase YvrE